MSVCVCVCGSCPYASTYVDVNVCGWVVVVRQRVYVGRCQVDQYQC